jgi:hypothetical protein
MVELFQLRQNEHVFFLWCIDPQNLFGDLWSSVAKYPNGFFLPTAQWPILLDEILKAALVEN